MAYSQNVMKMHEVKSEPIGPMKGEIDNAMIDFLFYIYLLAVVEPKGCTSPVSW